MILSDRPFACRTKCVLLALFTLIVVMRLPQAWAGGRFLDEEGAIYFAFAWHNGTSEALFRSFGGYLNLAANGTTLLAARLVQGGVVPLELAPYVTMTISLLFQTIPAILILTGSANWLKPRWAVLASLMVIAASPATEEVFSHSLHIQFHLALACALILALDPPKTKRSWLGHGLVLILAPLCGPAAIVLLPFFVLRSLVEWDRARLVQAGLLGLGSAVQLLLFFEAVPVRGHFPDPATLAALMFGRTVAMPLTNSSVASFFVERIYESWAALGLMWWLAAIAFAAYFTTLIRWALRDRRDAAIWLIVPGLALGLVSFGGGMIVSNYSDWFMPLAAQRYNFLPVVLASLGIISLARRLAGTARRLCIYLCILIQVSGIVSYWLPLGQLERGPYWRGEVAAWRVDHNTLLRGWPQWWKIDLSDQSRPCSQMAGGKPPPDEPIYCEAAWLEFVRDPQALPNK